MSTVDTQYLYSSLASDPDLSEIIGLFIEEMPGRIADLCACYRTGNWKELGRHAHQLKGACGSYGFDQLTSSAARLENACHETHDELLIRAALEDLTSLCARVRSAE